MPTKSKRRKNWALTGEEFDRLTDEELAELTPAQVGQIIRAIDRRMEKILGGIKKELLKLAKSQRELAD